MCVCDFFKESASDQICSVQSESSVCVCVCHTFSLWFKSEVANTEPVSLTLIFTSLMFFHVYLSLFHSPPSLISFRHSLIYSFIANTPPPHTHTYTAPHSLSLYNCNLELISLPPIDKKKKSKGNKFNK